MYDMIGMEQGAEEEDSNLHNLFLSMKSAIYSLDQSSRNHWHSPLPNLSCSRNGPLETNRPWLILWLTARSNAEKQLTPLMLIAS